MLQPQKKLLKNQQNNMKGVKNKIPSAGEPKVHIEKTAGALHPSRDIALEIEPKTEKKLKPAEKKSSKKVPESKLKAVKELVNSMKNSNTIMIVSTKGLPSPQLQKIKKDLRGKADVKIVKKNILNRAIDETKIPELAGLKEHIIADCAIAFSNEDGFELAGWLTENRNPISAKQGQTATDDINIEAGKTELAPGPDISALSAVGLKVSVEDGKIAIRMPHVLVKQGGLIDEKVASILQKLNIKPFKIGLNPLLVYDSKSKKIYAGIKIDKKETLDSLVLAKARAIGFAQKLGIMTRETIGYFLSKANSQAMALEKIQNQLNNQGGQI